MFISGCALKGMCLKGLMGDGSGEHEANWAVKELKGGIVTWDCNSLAWELLNNCLPPLKKGLGVLKKRGCVARKLLPKPSCSICGTSQVGTVRTPLGHLWL